MPGGDDVAQRDDSFFMWCSALISRVGSLLGMDVARDWRAVEIIGQCISERSGVSGVVKR